MPDVETRRATVWETTLRSYEIIKRKRQLQSFTLAPITCMVTTLIFVVTYNVRGSCSESNEMRDEIREDFPNMEVLSFYMCCTTEWLIAVTGYGVTSLLGLLSVPYICQSKLGFGRCWCSRNKSLELLRAEDDQDHDQQGGESGGRNREIVAMDCAMKYAVAACMISIFICLLGSSICSACGSYPIPHFVFAVLLFFSGTILCFLRMCSVEREIVFADSNGDVNSSHVHILSHHVKTLRYLSKTLRLMSFLCFVSSFCLVFALEFFASEILAGFVIVFVVYSVVCELIICEMITEDLNCVEGAIVTVANSGSLEEVPLGEEQLNTDDSSSTRNSSGDVIR